MLDEDRPIVVDEELLNRAFCGQYPEPAVHQPRAQGEPRSWLEWTLQRLGLGQ